MEIRNEQYHVHSSAVPVVVDENVCLLLVSKLVKKEKKLKSVEKENNLRSGFIETGRSLFS